MLVSGGYPEAYEKGKVIKGFNEIKTSHVFHAGAKHREGSCNFWWKSNGYYFFW